MTKWNFKIDVVCVCEFECRSQSPFEAYSVWCSFGCELQCLS